MAQIDITLTNTQYNTLVTTTDALKTKLNSIKPLLKTMMSQDGGQAKIKAYVQSHPTQARLLVKTMDLANFLDAYLDDIGWRRT